MRLGWRRWSRYLVFRLCLSLVAGCTGPSAGPAHAAVSEPSLEQIVAHNRQATGSGAVIHGLEIDLAMQDGGSSFDAVYKVTRDGRMRIDILKGGKRVYTEAYDGRRGWDQGEDGSAPVIDPHGDALWHGTQFPGGIFDLADMHENGHRLEYQGRETLDGVDYYVLKLTLSDGFVTYRYVNPDTWLIERGRDYRAFHPAVNGTKTWVETAWSDYRPVEGVMRAFASVNNDLVAGKQLASQKVTAVKVNPAFDPAIFAMPGA